MGSCAERSVCAPWISPHGSILSPRSTGQSAAVVGHEYDRVAKRRRAVYLGNVCIGGNPDHPEQALRLLERKILNGQPVQAIAGNWEAVREWLARYGPYRRQQLALQKKEEEETRRVREEHERLQLERITAELRERLEAEWRAEFNVAQAKADEPIQVATDAIAAAGDFARGRTEALRSAGVQLARIRSVQLETSEGASELDQLQVRANRLRLAQFGAFVAACQDAGLVEREQHRAERTGDAS